MAERLSDFIGFHTKSKVDKALNTMLGIVQGIGLDGRINESEKGLFNTWLKENESLCSKKPYSDLIPIIANSIEDNLLDEEEREDIKWFCNKLSSQEYYDSITADLQILHGILGGAAADGVISKEELAALSNWLDEHDHLKSYYPYDEIESLIVAVLKDGIVDERESRQLQAFFSEFISIKDDRTITAPLFLIEDTIQAVCSINVDIVIRNSTFCFTGKSSRYTKEELIELVTSHGGIASKGVTKEVNYLVVGAEGNECWAYSCYGRKVEKAVKMRKAGSRIQIIHEIDFRDALSGLI